MIYYFSLLDLFPYCLLFIVLFLVLKSKLPNKLITIFIVVFIFLGVRYGVGYDYFEYKDWLNNIESKSMEPFAVYLAKICSGIHYQWFFVFSSFLTLLPVYVVSKEYSINPIMSFMVYMLVPMLFLDGMSTVRNAIAYPMVLWSFMILLRGQHKVLAILPFIVALGFHGSSIVGLLILPFALFTVNKRIALAVWGISFVFSQGQIGDILIHYLDLPFLDKATWYLEHSRDGGSGRSLWLAVNLINIVNFFYWNKLRRCSDYNTKYLMVFNIGCVLYNLTISIDPTIALRLSNFCCIFLVMIMPYYIYVLSNNMNKNRRLVYLFLIVFFCSMFYFTITGTPRGEKISFFPYQTIFFHSDYINLQ